MKKFFGISLGTLVSMGVTMALVITLSGIGYAYLTAPTNVDYGTNQLNQLYEKTLFTVINESTGFEINITPDVVIGNLKIWLKPPDTSTISKHKFQNGETYTLTLDDSVGDWKMEVQVLEVGEWKVDVYLEYNQSLGFINQTG